MVAPKYPKPRRRLVGQPLLYAISMFASLGVFLVCTSIPRGCYHLRTRRLVWLRPRVREACRCRPKLNALNFLASCSVMSGIITGPHFIRFFGGLDAIQVGTIVAVLEIGAFGELAASIPRNQHNQLYIATSVAAGRVGDMIGRKGTLFIGAVVFTVGGVLQTFTVGFWSMILGRVISGFGVGLLSSVPTSQQP